MVHLSPTSNRNRRKINRENYRNHKEFGRYAKNYPFRWPAHSHRVKILSSNRHRSFNP